MTSPTAKHKTRKRLKAAAMGKHRKNTVRNHGTTTPDLALDKPNANERKQLEAHKARLAAKA